MSLKKNLTHSVAGNGFPVSWKIVAVLDEIILMMRRQKLLKSDLIVLSVSGVSKAEMKKLP